MELKLFFYKIIAAFTILLFAMPQSAWAQSSASLPMKVDAGKAKITQVGHATMAVHQEVRVDSFTMCADTVCVVDTVMWNTVEGTAKNG